MKVQGIRNFRNIAFFYHGSIYSKFSGESIYLSTIISSLKKKFNLVLIDGTPYVNFRKNDSKIYQMVLAYSRFLRFFIDERKMAKEQRTAVFISEDLYISILILPLAKFSRVKFVYRPSDVGKDYRIALSKMHFLPALFYSFTYFSELVLLDFSDFFISESPKITDYLTGYGIKKEDILYFPFIVNDKITFEKNKVDKFKARYSLQEKIVVVFVGSPKYPPNLESIIFIIKLAKKLENMRDFVFLIAGKGTEDVDAVLPENLIILGAVDDLDTVLFSSHIGISPSLVPGGLITKVVDYLVHGLLVLSTEEGASGIIENDHLVISDRNNFADKLKEISVNLKNGKMEVGTIPEIVRKTYLDETYPELFADLLYKRLAEFT